MTRDEVITSAVKQLHDAGVTEVNIALVDGITRALGPAAYNADAAVVACSDAKELAYVRDAFIREKLGVTDDDAAIDRVIHTVCEQLGSSNRNKLRVAFYYLLATHYDKAALFA